MGQPGGTRAAKYLARQFQQIGLGHLPGMRSNLQPIDARGFRFTTDTKLEIGDQSLKLGLDFVPMLYWVTRTRWPNHVERSGKLVYVGLGVVSKALGRNDLSGLNLRGKIAVLNEGIVGGKAGQWSDIYNISIQDELARRGAAGIIVIGRPHLTADQLYSVQRRMVTLWDLPKSFTPQLPTAVITEGRARAMFESGGADFDAAMKTLNAGGYASRDLGMNARISFAVRYEPKPSPSFNVIGFIPGTDETLSNQALVLTAHYDAFGLERGGKVYTGAADNALSVGKLIGISKALRAQPLRRPVIIIATNGEEMWFLGALHFLTSGAWPLNRIAAELNMDTIGSEAWGPTKILQVMAEDQTNMSPEIRAVAQEMGLQYVPDPIVSARLYQRSDHFEFARRGIPSVYIGAYPDTFDKLGDRFRRAFGGGPNEVGEIHEAGDVIDPRWNWNGVSTAADVYLRLMRRIGNGDTRPSWTTGSPLNRPRAVHPL